MEEKKLTVILSLIIPNIIELIIKNNNITASKAAEEFYSSRLYELLEDEETKLWHFSPMTLYNMYSEEKKTGTITFPEEA